MEIEGYVHQIWWPFHNKTHIIGTCRVCAFCITVTAVLAQAKMGIFQTITVWLDLYVFTNIVLVQIVHLEESEQTNLAIYPCMWTFRAWLPAVTFLHSSQLNQNFPSTLCLFCSHLTTTMGTHIRKAKNPTNSSDSPQESMIPRQNNDRDLYAFLQHDFSGCISN